MPDNGHEGGRMYIGRSGNRQLQIAVDVDDSDPSGDGEVGFVNLNWPPHVGWDLSDELLTCPKTRIRPVELARLELATPCLQRLFGAGFCLLRCWWSASQVAVSDRQSPLWTGRSGTRRPGP